MTWIHYNPLSIVVEKYEDDSKKYCTKSHRQKISSVKC